MAKLIVVTWALVALTVIVHAAGLVIAIKPVLKSAAIARKRFCPVTRLVVKTVSWLIVIHMMEIAVWAVFYWVSRCFPTFESSLYFSAVTYTTVGYGDLILPAEWRLLGPVESLAGILMCGLSTGLIFATMTRIVAVRGGQAHNGARESANAHQRVIV